MLEKVFKPQEIEGKIYEMWESGGYFVPKIDQKKKPFTIILPLPNANDPMHIGHALFTVEDILVRYHRMKGEPTLWLPGGDHAGIETQFVFEKHLAKEGKNRFDFDRQTLYQMIWDFADKNKNLNKNQMKRLGFSLDWTRYHYSLEPEIVTQVLTTFKKLHKDGLIYRAERLVNYCTKCGTAFSDLEVKYEERADPLYYIKYGPFVIATTRPETKFGDTAVAFHPGDKRYEKYLDQEIEVQGVNGSFKVKVIADEAIDPKFGTGIEKVTPAHDFLDYEIAQRHNLPFKKVIDLEGRLTEVAGPFAGLKVKVAREQIAAKMQEPGVNLIDHIDSKYVHNIAVCYRCGTTIEPMLISQWFVKVKGLAKEAMKRVKDGETKIVPQKRFEKMYFDWLEKIADWNISRQIVWGPRIPVWYKIEKDAPNLWVVWLDGAEKRQGNVQTFIKDGFTLEKIKAGLQKVLTLSYLSQAEPKYIVSEQEPDISKEVDPNVIGYLPETDTFDTWFLSGQWPISTLKSRPGDFEYFYPTSVLDTLWDIIFFWVGRMMMLGIYLTGKAPFGVIHLHARVIDKQGRKMSKSKGNVIDPITMVEKYGADALRMALIIGVAPASDIAISEEKIKGMRNFTNKLWNIGRFIIEDSRRTMFGNPSEPDDQLRSRVDQLAKQVTEDIDNYLFGRASETLYGFIWHEFADVQIEDYKKGLLSYSVLFDSFRTLLKLLHPFTPFVTEEIWGKLPGNKGQPLITSEWPK